MEPFSLKDIIESLLFVAQKPITVAQLKKASGVDETSLIKEALKELETDYASRGGGFCLYEVAEGYQLRTRPQFSEHIKRLIEPAPQKLSKPAMETLALVAYRQPILRNEVEQIRGVDCGGTLRVLMEKNLVRILGHKELPGRPLIYGTTKYFLELFGFKNLKDLPVLQSVEDLLAKRPADENLQQALLLPNEQPGSGSLDEEQEPTEACSQNDASSQDDEPNENDVQTGFETVGLEYEDKNDEYADRDDLFDDLTDDDAGDIQNDPGGS